MNDDTLNTLFADDDSSKIPALTLQTVTDGTLSPVSSNRVFTTKVTSSQKPFDATPLVFLHGWGSNSVSWLPLIEKMHALQRPMLVIDLPGFGCNQAIGNDLSVMQMENVMDAVAACIPPRCVLVGWSLGGMLATQLAHRYPQQVESLITIASNACFSVKPGWQNACTETVFQQFFHGFAQQPGMTFSKFIKLQAQGDANRKQVIRTLQQAQIAPSDEQQESWLCALELLAAFDNRNICKQIHQPWLQVFGENDSLVPIAASTDIQGLMPESVANKILRLKGVGHAPHISIPEALADEIVNHLQASPYHRHKQAIADSFSKAANSYDDMAQLQVRVAQTLLARRSSYEGNILDLGCGTGFCSKSITRASNTLFGLDIAQGMLEKAKQVIPEQHRLCADLEFLPLQACVMDGIVSSLSVQWCDDLSRVFAECYRVLQPGGWVLLSTLLPGTLHELNDAWRAVDGFVHVNDFIGEDDVIRFAKDAGFIVDQITVRDEVMWFDSVMQLMKGLKGIGAHNINAGKNRGLTAKGKIMQMQQAYEQHRTGEGLPATYKVIYLSLQKTAETI
ncbi:Malonyl-[acyl-carrier protein] O-methyltransferase [Thalassocella blandensis]|nr:Malonyl-[acyl-carrier protein] O-methyltransferase [Thalassocella blandensis]